MVFYTDENQMNADFGVRISDFRVRKLKSSYFLFRNPQSAFRNRSTFWSRWLFPFFRYLWLGCLFGCLLGSFLLDCLFWLFLFTPFHALWRRSQKTFGPKFPALFFPFSPPRYFPIPFTSRHCDLLIFKFGFRNAECGMKRQKHQN